MKLTEQEQEFIEYYQLEQVNLNTFKDKRGFFLKKHKAHNGFPGWNYVLMADDDGGEGTPYLYKDISDAYIKGLQSIIDYRLG